MAHDVTATKYRPQSFNSLGGQDFVSSALRNSLDNKSFAAAFLLSGPRGVGKTTTARILAKGLNCINGPTGNPCNACEHCTLINAGNNSDVIEIDGASNTSINDVKIIQEELQYPPSISRYKVYIVDEVHMLSKSAFNALLKTIEEPPKYVIFIFATTEINEVPATIKSRCQQFNLRLIPSDIIYKNLEQVLKDKNITYEVEALRWIANEGNGSMRDAYTLLDQIISFSNGEILLKKIQHKLGIAGEEKIASLITALIEQNMNSLFNNLNHILETGVSSEQLIVDFIKYLRNLLLIKANIKIKKDIDFDPIYYTAPIIEKLTIDDIENIIELSFEMYEKARYSVDLKIELEIFFLKIMKYKDFIRPKQILRQLSSLQNFITEKAEITNEKKKSTLEQTPIQSNVSHETLENPNFNESKINSSEKEQPQNIQQENIQQNSNENSLDIHNVIKNLKTLISKNEFDLLKIIEEATDIWLENQNLFIKVSKQRNYDVLMSKQNLLNTKLTTLLGKFISIKPQFIPIEKDETNMPLSQKNKILLTNTFECIDIN